MSFQVGWTGPYPELSRKRPTADLVSRKVLTPLLGQIMLCVLTQFVAYKTVQLQSWLVQDFFFLNSYQDNQSDFHYRFKPPRVDLEKSNIENSENTALFLVSCFQYILMSVVLSVGPPFRKPMKSNGWYSHAFNLNPTNTCQRLFFSRYSWICLFQAGCFGSRPNGWSRLYN